MSEIGSSATAPTSRRLFSWSRFSIRSLLVLTLVAGALAAWWSAKLRRQQREEHAVQLLTASPNAIGWNYNPVPLIRAVNHLQAMGKPDALKALRRFAAENLTDGGPTSKHECLELVVALLFDRTDPEDRFPASDVFADPGNFELARDRWSVSITVEGDIPFHNQVIGAFSGMTGDNTYLIEWAERHARLRTSPLRPADDPFAAAEAAVQSLYPEPDESSSNSDDEDEQAIKFHVREQVFRSVSHLLPLADQDRSKWSFYEDKDWSRFKALCDSLKIRWSDERQTYVTDVQAQ